MKPSGRIILGPRAIDLCRLPADAGLLVLSRINVVYGSLLPSRD